MALAQPEVAIVHDLFQDLDLDGDGFRDMPLPPVPDPVGVPFGGGPSQSSLIVSDNGLALDSAVILQAIDPDLANETAPFQRTLGTYDAFYDDVEIAPGGFAIGREEVINRMLLEIRSDDPGGFQTDTVTLDMQVRTSARITYFTPRIAGVQLGNTFVSQVDGNFAVLGAAFTGEGQASGDPTLTNAGIYEVDAITSIATWTYEDVGLSLQVPVGVTPGSFVEEVAAEYREFVEFQIDNFGGLVTLTAFGGFRFERIGEGVNLLSARVLEEGVSVRFLPEPNAQLGAVVVLAVLAALRRRARTAR